MDDLQAALTLTDAQAYRIRNSVQSGLGQWARILAEREGASQEDLLEVYDTLSFYSEGVNLDRFVRLLGVYRIPEQLSRVEGTFTGTPAVSVTDGTRIQFDGDGTVWVVADGPYIIGGGGTVTGYLEREEADEADPGASSDWTILDTIVGLTSFVSTLQTIVGRPVETDGEMRLRASREAFRRAQGPLKAIEASLLEVEGVSFALAADNPSTDPTDADGIPLGATNAVVEGGATADIVTALLSSRPAGGQMFGLPGATYEEEVRDLGSGRIITVGFNRVEGVDMYIRATLTTSTSEQLAPADLEDSVKDLLGEQEIFGIGDDVLPWQLESLIAVAGYPGIDNALIEVSDDGVIWQTGKYAITIRQRGEFDPTRVTVVEI